MVRQANPEGWNDENKQRLSSMFQVKRTHQIGCRRADGWCKVRAGGLDKTAHDRPEPRLGPNGFEMDRDHDKQMLQNYP